ncbi:MAG: hypothetical protein GY749_49435 [Desulfobacteraceae bacterium]|nr:hypothetical protein [Desulfobacteraceae bacterium]
MQNAISEILKGIPQGKVFDSHYAISQLMKLHSDVYNTFVSGAEDTNGTFAARHGQIAKEIDKFDTISKNSNKSWSENIHGNPSECTAWVKL